MIHTSSTARRAHETASFYACLHTRRGVITRSAAPRRSFFKRVARRAERRAGKRIDVHEAVAEVTCETCGHIQCADVWCAYADDPCMDGLFDDERDMRGVSVSFAAPDLESFAERFRREFGCSPYGDDEDEDELDDFETADRDARAWRDLYDDLYDDLDDGC